MEVMYFAGLFDGEGSIQIVSQKGSSGNINYSLRTRVNMKCRDVIYGIQKTFGGFICKQKLQQQYAWQCSGIEAGNILRLILPYLIEKKEQAELALEFLEFFEYNGESKQRSNKEKELQELYRLKMKILKKKDWWIK